MPKLETGDVCKHATDEVRKLVAALQEARSARAAWVERENDLKSQIIAWLDGADAVLDGKAALVRVSVVTSRRFDPKAFASDHPDLHEQYVVPSHSTRVLV